MKTTITFSKEFAIPRSLPHAYGQEADSSDIFDDSVAVVDGKLVLQSKCGSTTFLQWEETEDAFLIPASISQYEGAYSALNAVWGIDFPPCEIGEVESSLGNFATIEGYEVARRFAKGGN